MTTTVAVTYDCCHDTYQAPTTIPDDGSALRHATTVDTVMLVLDLQHAVNHPECVEETA
jgi:hypothetical protein